MPEQERFKRQRKAAAFWEASYHVVQQCKQSLGGIYLGPKRFVTLATQHSQTERDKGIEKRGKPLTSDNRLTRLFDEETSFPEWWLLRREFGSRR